MHDNFEGSLSTLLFEARPSPCCLRYPNLAVNETEKSQGILEYDSLHALVFGVCVRGSDMRSSSWWSNYYKYQTQS
jgi:hypothetical protein